jgi:hypothetical protein
MQSFANICIGKLRNIQTCNLCETCELEIIETYTQPHTHTQLVDCRVCQT